MLRKYDVIRAFDAGTAIFFFYSSSKDKIFEFFILPLLLTIIQYLQKMITTA